MNDLKSQILSLERAHLLETASIVANAVVAKNNVNVETYQPAISGITSMEHIESIEQFSRIILLNAAENTEYNSIVSIAMDNVGKKNLVIEVTTIAVLGSIGIAALRIILNPLSKEKIKYTNKDGTKVEIERERNNDTSFLGKILQKVFS